MHSLLMNFALLLAGGRNVIEMEKKDNITLQAPIVAPVSQHWEGVDGTWSTFEIRVGTPEQVYRVLPATSWQESWVVYGAAASVCDTSLGVATGCQDARGGVFSNYTSTTWEQGKQYALGVDTNLGESGEGQYGFDTVGLGYTNDTGPTLTHQIVAAIVSDTFWFGMLGLGFQPTNFSGYGDPQPSFSDSLYMGGSISSMSWSYTAGAYYRLKSVFGSLIFGGYDSSRFIPNDVVFTMTGDNLRDIVLTIRSITATTASENITLMSTPELAFIDSVVPELWLPVDVCQAFEKAFSLSLDNTTGTYLINSTTHENLLDMNPNVTFTLGNQKTGGPTVDVVFPYASFDLNVTAPILPNSSSLYFPIMRATDESQYTLGRTFLQEAYVTADYNTRTFNVSQCSFDDTASPSIVAIPSSQPDPTSNSTSPAGSKPHLNSGAKLGGGAIAGIVLGALALSVLIAGVLFCCIHGLLCFKKRISGPSTPIHEIDPGTRIEKHSIYAQQASGFRSELSGQDAKVEIQGNPIMHPQELEADVPVVLESGSVGDDREVDALSTIREYRTPMAELGVDQRRLGEGHEPDIVSPATETETIRSITGRTGTGSPSVGTPSEATWSPSSPVQKRRTRFEER